MTAMAELNCGNCRYSSGDKYDPTLLCMRRAPSIRDRKEDRMITDARWPRVYRHVWCGEHEPGEAKGDTA